MSSSASSGAPFLSRWRKLTEDSSHVLNIQIKISDAQGERRGARHRMTLSPGEETKHLHEALKPMAALVTLLLIWTITEQLNATVSNRTISRWLPFSRTKDSSLSSVPVTVDVPPRTHFTRSKSRMRSHSMHINPAQRSFDQLRSYPYIQL